MSQHPMRKVLSSLSRKWFTPRRSRPIRRQLLLELESLEPREMPAANPALALGAEPERPVPLPPPRLLPHPRPLDQPRSDSIFSW